jgi:hypothetical protein
MLRKLGLKLQTPPSVPEHFSTFMTDQEKRTERLEAVLKGVPEDRPGSLGFDVTCRLPDVDRACQTYCPLAHVHA